MVNDVARCDSKCCSEGRAGAGLRTRASAAGGSPDCARHTLRGSTEQRVCGFGVAVLQMLPLVLVLPVNTQFELVDKSYNAWGTVFLAIRLQLSNDVLPALGGSKHASTSSSSSHGLCAVHGMTSFQKMSVDFAIPPVLGVLMLLSFLVLHVSHCADHREWQMLSWRLWPRLYDCR